MVTTSRLALLDVVGRDGDDLIHLTGPVQVVVRGSMSTPGGTASPVELRLDASRVRGVGLKTGARYWADGLHQSSHQPTECCAPFDVLGCFQLLGSGPSGVQLTRLTLTVRFRVTLPADGRVRVVAEEVMLQPDPSASPGARSYQNGEER